MLGTEMLHSRVVHSMPLEPSLYHGLTRTITMLYNSLCTHLTHTKILRKGVQLNSARTPKPQHRYVDTKMLEFLQSPLF